MSHLLLLGFSRFKLQLHAKNKIQFSKATLFVVVVVVVVAIA
jgi:hypothetical protein